MPGEERNILVGKVALFSVVGLALLFLTPNAGYRPYEILVGTAVLWIGFELLFRNKDPAKPGRALKLGVFLMVFDWIVENAGAIMGLWTTHNSVFPVGAVPIEIMARTVIGGSAWAITLPKKPTKQFLALEVLLFGVYGALGEYMLGLNGVMRYYGGWAPIHAFFGYVITWIILLALWYKVIRKN